MLTHSSLKPTHRLLRFAIVLFCTVIIAGTSFLLYLHGSLIDPIMWRDTSLQDFRTSVSVLTPRALERVLAIAPTLGRNETKSPFLIFLTTVETPYGLAIFARVGTVAPHALPDPHLIISSEKQTYALNTTLIEAGLNLEENEPLYEGYGVHNGNGEYIAWCNGANADDVELCKALRGHVTSRIALDLAVATEYFTHQGYSEINVPAAVARTRALKEQATTLYEAGDVALAELGQWKTYENTAHKYHIRYPPSHMVLDNRTYDDIARFGYPLLEIAALRVRVDKRVAELTSINGETPVKTLVQDSIIAGRDGLLMKLYNPSQQYGHHYLIEQNGFTYDLYFRDFDSNLEKIIVQTFAFVD